MTDQRGVGVLRRTLGRLMSSQDEIEAAELQRDVRVSGCCPIAAAHDREEVTLAGTLRTVTLRPRGGIPALEAEVYDGSGTVTVIWLGRRRIAGIEPGRAIQVSGRVSMHDGAAVMFNPRYELRA